jgi:hypothetical protein
MGVLALTLRGRKFVWPELDGGWYWTRCWSGDAALFPVSRHCDLTDSSEAARDNCVLGAVGREGDADLARSCRLALCWSTCWDKGLRSLVAGDAGRDCRCRVCPSPVGVPGT